MDISVIIVSWNVRNKLQANLEALYKSGGDFSFEVIVVDNNSKDDSAVMLSEKFPQVKLISNSDNLGFAKACNQGIKIAQGDYILLLNPDMKVFPETLFNLWSWVKQNEIVTVVGCHLVDEMGATVPQVRRFPRLADQLAIVLKLPHLFPRITQKYLLPDFNYQQATAVDSVRGSFFLINKLNYQKLAPGRLPLLDERYFIWFEEVDFCQEVKKMGGAVWYTPAAKCLDYVGASFGQVRRGQTQLYFRDSMLKYFRKWRPIYEYLILWLAWLPLFLIASILCRKKSR